MKEWLDLPVIVLTILTLASSLYLVFYRFGLKREKYTFLDLRVDTKVVDTIRELLVVSITIQLENKGQTRIDARTQKNFNQFVNFLYSDSGDQCEHAGTLKIRAVPSLRQSCVFDWYSLQSIKGICILKDGEQTNDDLEQINYLAEFQDPIKDYQDVDFWLEPSEKYDLRIMVALPPGLYAVKAYFLGKITAHREDEYWSHTQLFSLKNPKAEDCPANKK